MRNGKTQSKKDIELCVTALDKFIGPRFAQMAQFGVGLYLV